MELKISLITQARMGSTRFPGKVLKKINEIELLELHVNRLKKSEKISEIIVATTKNEEDKIIYEKSINLGVKSFKGSELDVLDRYYQVAKIENSDWIVRVTSDCPLIDPNLVDNVVQFAINNDKDYCSNRLLESYPDGQDVEVIKFKALEKAWKEAKLNSEREHVTPFIIKNSDYKGGLLFSATNFDCLSDFSNIRMTVDEVLDIKLIEILITKLGVNRTWKEYTDFIIDNNLTKINGQIIRNEGYLNSIKKET
jgi:spore coat polysaccharide biosynthesis protein SpsF (cytidylyltransferase family)